MFKSIFWPSYFACSFRLRYQCKAQRCEGCSGKMNSMSARPTTDPKQFMTLCERLSTSLALPSLLPLGFWHITHSCDYLCVSLQVKSNLKHHSWLCLLPSPSAHGCHSAGEPPWNDFDISRLHLGLLISKLAQKNSYHLALDSSANCSVAKAFLLQLTQGNFNWSCLVSESVQQWKIPKMFLFA